MDDQTQTETDITVLKRIVALLFALAGVAEMASRRSYPVRFLVLWLLRRAEGRVLDLLGLELENPAGVRRGSDPSDALDLAESLRALAHEMKDLMAQYRWLCRSWHGDEADEIAGRRPTPGNNRRAGAALLLSALAGLLAAPFPDTS